MSSLPPLHQAVIDGDEIALKQLCRNRAALEARDNLGFTALEIAYLLNRRVAASQLDPSAKFFIKVLPKGATMALNFSEEEFQSQFKVEYLPHLYFADYAELKRVLANCPWVLANSFLGEENRLQAIGFAPELNAGRCAKISIRWIDDQLEYGVFAEADISAGTYIGEFTGHVRQLSRQRPSHNSYCFHYPTRLWSWNYYAIDAQTMGNQTRFINHSDRPNLSPLCLCERRLLHIVFIAKVAIRKGDQLTYDYGQDYWKTRDKIDI